MIYLYAIIDRPERPIPDSLGLTGTPYFSLAYRDIAAVVSHLRETEVIPTPDNLWQHEEAVETLMTDQAVLPVRFSTILSDEAAVQAVLAGHYADFVTNLERVRGRVEVGLRVMGLDTAGQSLSLASGKYPADAPPPRSSLDKGGGGGQEGSGRSYLLARLEQERQIQTHQREGEALAAELEAQLLELAVESVHQVLATPHLLLAAAYLLERDRVITFRQAVETLSVAYPTLRFLCTGPWPAYNFVTTTAPTGTR